MNIFEEDKNLLIILLSFSDGSIWISDSFHQKNLYSDIKDSMSIKTEGLISSVFSFWCCMLLNASVIYISGRNNNTIMITKNKQILFLTFDNSLKKYFIRIVMYSQETPGINILYPDILKVVFAIPLTDIGNMWYVLMNYGGAYLIFEKKRENVTFDFVSNSLNLNFSTDFRSIFLSSFFISTIEFLFLFNTNSEPLSLNFIHPIPHNFIAYEFSSYFVENFFGNNNFFFEMFEKGLIKDDDFDGLVMTNRNGEIKVFAFPSFRLFETKFFQNKSDELTTTTTTAENKNKYLSSVDIYDYNILNYQSSLGFSFMHCMRSTTINTFMKLNSAVACMIRLININESLPSGKQWEDEDDVGYVDVVDRKTGREEEDLLPVVFIVSAETQELCFIPLFDVVNEYKSFYEKLEKSLKQSSDFSVWFESSFGIDSKDFPIFFDQCHILVKSLYGNISSSFEGDKKKKDLLAEESMVMFVMNLFGCI
jgi:hypothetical protein